MLVLSAAAGASSITYSSSLPLRRTNFSDSLGLSQFNSHLGKLQSVDIFFQSDLTTFGHFMNTGRTSETFVFNTDVVSKVTGPNGVKLTVDPFYSTGSVTVAAGAKKQFGSAYPVGTATADTGLFTHGLSAFIGTGNFNLAYTPTANASFASGGSNISVTQTTLVDYKATVTYNYTTNTAVPEFGTSVTLGALFLTGGLSMLRNRRRAR